MGIIKLLREGTWWVTPKTDPRWKGSGHSSAVGMYAEPREAKEHIERMKSILGDPPEDLEWGYMKD